MGYRFPIARRLLGFAARARQNWLLRHQNPFNFVIHLVGIPLAVAGVPLLFLAPWYWGVGAIVVGYFLQWVGHRVEGNDVGELIPIKRALGLPTVAIAPGRPGNPTRGASPGLPHHRYRPRPPRLRDLSHSRRPAQLPAARGRPTGTAGKLRQFSRRAGR
ncbi:MAG: DUF962 domain-containing protein [Gemmataceae bacterium]|nr:DUF962 domain-containing protein [Gemmataceae bacterium]